MINRNRIPIEFFQFEGIKYYKGRSIITDIDYEKFLEGKAMTDFEIFILRLFDCSFNHLKQNDKIRIIAPFFNRKYNTVKNHLQAFVIQENLPKFLKAPSLLIPQPLSVPVIPVDKSNDFSILLDRFALLAIDTYDLWRVNQDAPWMGFITKIDDISTEVPATKRQKLDNYSAQNALDAEKDLVKYFEEILDHNTRVLEVAQSLLEKVLSMEELIHMPPAIKVTENWLENFPILLPASCFKDLSHQIKAIDEIRGLESTFEVYDQTKSQHTFHNWTSAEFRHAFEIEKRMIGSLDYTFVPEDINLDYLKNYSEELLHVINGAPSLLPFDKFFNIIKGMRFETEFHSDIHASPHITLYNVQAGNTTFFLVHPLIGYFLKFLGSKNLNAQRNAVMKLLRKVGHGRVVVLKEGEAALISPAYNHFVFVDENLQQDREVTSIIATEIPIKEFYK